VPSDWDKGTMGQLLASAGQSLLFAAPLPRWVNGTGRDGALEPRQLGSPQAQEHHTPKSSEPQAFD
jgi:hypothetical protein